MKIKDFLDTYSIDSIAIKFKDVLNNKIIWKIINKSNGVLSYQKHYPTSILVNSIFDTNFEFGSIVDFEITLDRLYKKCDYSPKTINNFEVEYVENETADTIVLVLANIDE